MDVGYKVFVREAAREILPKTGKKRTAVKEFIVGLSDASNHMSDFEVPDQDTGRSFQVTIIAGFAITWWVDSPVWEVKVVEIRRAELG